MTPYTPLIPIMSLLLDDKDIQAKIKTENTFKASQTRFLNSFLSIKESNIFFISSSL